MSNWGEKKMQRRSKSFEGANEERIVNALKIAMLAELFPTDSPFRPACASKTI